MKQWAVLAKLAARSLWRMQRRYALTVLGVAVGCATLFAVLATNSATQDALEAFLEPPGEVDVYARALGSTDASIPTRTIETLTRLSGVRGVVPGVTFQSAVLDDSGAERAQLAVTGIPIAGRAASIYGINLESGRDVGADAAEVLMPAGIALELSTNVGDELTLATPTGVTKVKVVGTLRDRGSDRSLYGSTSFVRRVYGRGPVVNTLALDVGDDVDLDSWLRGARTAVGGAALLETAAERGASFRGFVRAVTASLTLTSVLALFVASFLVFITLSVAVSERAPTHATMRAIGALPRQIVVLVLVEVALMATAASALALPIGYALATVTNRAVAALMGLPPQPLGTPIHAAAIATAVTILVAVAGASVPARAASRASVLLRSSPAPRGRRGTTVGGFLLAAGLVFSEGTSSIGRAASVVLILLGASLLVPLAVGPLIRFIAWATRHLSRAGALATSSTRGAAHLRARGSYTVALLMAVIGLTTATGATHRSLRSAIDEVIGRQAGTTVQVYAPGVVDTQVEARLRGLRGVTGVAAIAFGVAEVVHPSRAPVTIAVVDPTTYFDVSGQVWLSGSHRLAREGLVGGGTLLMPDPLARQLGVAIGDAVRIASPSGPLSFRIAATFAGVGTDVPLIIGQRDRVALGTDRASAFLLATSKGETESVKREVMASVAKEYGLLVETAVDVRESVRRQLGGFFGLGYSVLAMAGLVGALAVANTVAVSIIDRKREIAILRTAGALRRQVRKMFVVEATLLAATAALLSVPLSLVLTRVVIATQRDALGFSLEFVFPVTFAALVSASAVACSSACAWVPSRRAARLDPLTALSFD